MENSSNRFLEKIPPRFHGCQEFLFPQEEIAEKAPNLILLGKIGSGKTTLACKLGLRKIAILQKGDYPRGYFVFTTVPDLLDQIRETYQETDPNNYWQQKVRLERTAKADVLILDDLGVEKPSEWVSEKLYQLVNDRYNQMRDGLIITTNLPLERVAERIGERVISRLIEMCLVVELSGEDRRLEKYGKSN